MFAQLELLAETLRLKKACEKLQNMRDDVDHAVFILAANKVEMAIDNLNKKMLAHFAEEDEVSSLLLHLKTIMIALRKPKGAEAGFNVETAGTSLESAFQDCESPDDA